MSCESATSTYARRVAPALAVALDCSETDARDLLLEVRELAANNAARTMGNSATQWDRLRRKAADARATEATAEVFRAMLAMDPPIAPPTHGDADPEHGVPLPSAMSERYGWQEIGETLEDAREGRVLPSLANQVRAGQLVRQLTPPPRASLDLTDMHAMPEGYERAAAFMQMALILGGDAQREAVIGLLRESHTLLAKPMMVAAVLPSLRGWTDEDRAVVVAAGLASARSLAGAHRLNGLAAMFEHARGAERGRVLGQILADVRAANINAGDSLGAAYTLENHFARMPVTAAQADALARVAPHLTADETRAALALAAAEVRGEKNQLYALILLASALPPEERAGVYAEHRIAERSRAAVDDLFGDTSRIDTLLGAYAAQEGPAGARQLVDAITISRDTLVGRARALTALISLTPEAEREAAFSAALHAARDGSAWVLSADAMIDLLPHAPDEQRAGLAHEAFELLRGGGGSHWHMHEIGLLMPYLPPQHDDELLVELRATPREARPFLLAAFAIRREKANPMLAKQVRAEAIRTANRIKNPRARGTATAALRRALHVTPGEVPR